MRNYLASGARRNFLKRGRSRGGNSATIRRLAVAIVLGAAIAGLTLSGAAQAASPHYRVKGVAVATVQRLAERGNLHYQTYLGYMYETGHGVPQDYHLAAFWYFQAADRGDVRAQYLLGMLYDRGQGVARDHVEAHKWVNLAASRAGRADRDYFTRIRNAIASKLTRDQIYQAQWRARQWAEQRGR